jgi:hypothetical protein
MITLKDFMETVDYRITEGGDYGWNCYGYDAYMLDSWNGDQDGHSFTIIFDTKTQTVYEVQAHDYVRQRAYRLINPEFKSAHDLEAGQRDVNLNEAWDDVDYVDLETDEDFLEKAQAIAANEDYDTRVQVPVDFTDDELLTYMTMAHERDMTFNAFVEMALKSVIDEIKIKKELDNILPEFPVDKIKKKKKGKK